MNKADMTPHETTPEQREIAADIEATRERLGETVEELAHRLDVKAQVQGKVDEKKQAVHAKVDETKEAVHAKVDHTKEAVQAKVTEAKETVQAGLADPKTKLSHAVRRCRTVAADGASHRDVQLAAGVAALAGLVGAILLRRTR